MHASINIFYYALITYCLNFFVGSKYHLILPEINFLTLLSLNCEYFTSKLNAFINSNLILASPKSDSTASSLSISQVIKKTLILEAPSYVFIVY